MVGLGWRLKRRRVARVVSPGHKMRWASVACASCPAQPMLLAALEASAPRLSWASLSGPVPSTSSVGVLECRWMTCALWLLMWMCSTRCVHPLFNACQLQCFTCQPEPYACPCALPASASSQPALSLHRA